MIPYKLEHTIAELNSNEAAAQGLLEAYTGKVIPKPEALILLKRVPDHKWYLSEKLGRDIGTRVAAVDLVENFYEPRAKRSVGLARFFRIARPRLGSWLSTYFVAKGGLTNL